MEREVSVSERDAADAFLAVSRMNVALFSSLSRAELETPLSHPEQGDITVDWILHTLAGHQLGHLRQIEEIAGRGAGSA